MVRFLVPLRRTASIRCSGTPQSPKPPTKMVAPSVSLAMAASAEATRLSMSVEGPNVLSSPDESVLQARPRANRIAPRHRAAHPRASSRTPGYPYPGCFCERVWICLIVKELNFLPTTKSLQEYERKGLARETELGVRPSSGHPQGFVWI